jgi:dihydroorotate dehydrogenase
VAVRAATRKPLILKLSPDYPEENRRTIVPAALDSGIDVVNFGNTRRVGEPRLSQGAGGLSGPALFDNVLATVRALRRVVGPGRGLIATGGIDTPARAVAAIEAGADAVSSSRSSFGPRPRRIAEALLAGWTDGPAANRELRAPD